MTMPFLHHSNDNAFLCYTDNNFHCSNNKSLFCSIYIAVHCSIGIYCKFFLWSFHSIFVGVIILIYTFALFLSVFISKWHVFNAITYTLNAWKGSNKNSVNCVHQEMSHIFHINQGRGIVLIAQKSRKPQRLMIKESNMSGLYLTLLHLPNVFMIWRKMIFWLMTKESDMPGLHPTWLHHLNVFDLPLTFQILSLMFLVNMKMHHFQVMMNDGQNFQRVTFMKE